ncbi:uncharacterized protein [Paramormyrops kingsleyae]|uniref:uncharacterized protein isoform X2 n=1 Tax=Paramormyrops kingsleyae TaxID=1676925 RepID=UPI003B96F08E
MIMIISTLILVLALLMQSASASADDSIAFSVCWMIKENTSPDRPEIKLFLNDSQLEPIETRGKLTSLTVSPSDTHTLRLKNGGGSRLWRFSVNSGLNTVIVRSEYKAQDKPSAETLEALKHFKPTQVFACENNTLYLCQEDVIVVLGSTHRFPLKVVSRSSATLLLSWVADSPLPPDPVHGVSLYRSPPDAQAAKVTYTTRADRYRFTSLDACSNYLGCLELAGSSSVICLKTLTDPDVPKNFSVRAWNSSSITIAWDCSEKQLYSSFLVTMLQLNASSHVVETASLKHERKPFIFTVNDLPPCSKVKFALQTVCDSSGESRMSSSVVIDGNSANSEIRNLRQVASSPGSYSLRWTVPNTSSIAVFRVYHQGALQKSTFLPTHRVVGLQPCGRYKARVDAVCGDSVVMSTRTIQTSTGPGSIFDLQFHQQNSTASWSSASGPAKAFAYSLSHPNGSLVSSGRVRQTDVLLSGLVPGSPYQMEVWEECGGERGRPATLRFLRQPVPDDDVLYPVPKGRHLGSHFNPDLHAAIIVPWMLPESLREPKAKARVELESIIRAKLQAIFSGLPYPVEVKLLEFEDLNSTGQTKIPFQVLDLSNDDVKVKLSSEELLTYIQSLSLAQITIKDHLIYWDDPDECGSYELNWCDSSSTCINTLLSYTCVCQEGYYNVGHFLIPPVPSACYKNGMFVECKESLVAGGLAKEFLTGFLGGNVSVILNDGRCAVNETDAFYFFKIAGKPSECGAERQMNKTHIEFSSSLTVTLSHEKTITRNDLRLLWRCTYPRHFLHGARVNMDAEWFSSHSVVSYNFSHILDVGMMLYNDTSFMYNYTDGVVLSPEDYLFLEVTLQAQDTLAHDMLLAVMSCWATGTVDAVEDRKAFFLKDGCPSDDTFSWLTLNGSGKSSRFSVQMFTMSVNDELPIYIHCLTKICTPDEDCVTECPPTKNYPKMKRRQRGSSQERFAVVSAGPVFMDRGEWMSKGEFACEWTCEFLMRTCVMLVLLHSSPLFQGMGCSLLLLYLWERLAFLL